MSNLRLFDPAFNDNFDAAVRRFFSPSLFEAADTPQLKMRLDVTENDKALPPKVQRLLAQHIGARTVVVKSSHMSLVSHAREVAALIERAARSAGQ